MQVSEHGLDLIRKWEGPPRLRARLCEGDKYEVGYGCTYYPDNRPVRRGDTITPEQVPIMLAHCMKTEMAPIRRAFKREPDQFWFDAFASFGYNTDSYAVVGIPARSLVLFNKGHFQDAAAAFVGWISATDSGPSTIEQRNPYYSGAWEIRNGVARWISPDGRPCKYRKKMRGLLRRRLAEGCVALGYDWEVACANDAVHLQTERVWNERKYRWEDGVISKTELKDVLPVARRYPLGYEDVEPEVTAFEELTIPHPGAVSTPDVLFEDPTPDTPMTTEDLQYREIRRSGGDMTFEEFRGLGGVALERDQTPNIDPAAPAKRMEDSETHRGLSKRESGTESLGVGTVITGTGGAVTALSQVTGYFEEFSKSAIFTTLLAIGVICLGVGAWRWWRGGIIAYEGRQTATSRKE